MKKRSEEIRGAREREKKFKGSLIHKKTKQEMILL